MKIGFDAKRLFFNPRGLGSYSRNLIHALLKCYPQHQYYLYAPKLRPACYFQEILPQHDNLHLRTPASWWPRHLQGLWRSYFVASQISKDQLDIYHGLSHEIPLGVPLQTKTLVTIHDLIFLKFPGYFSAIDRKIYTKKISYAVKAADGVLAISENTKKDLRDRMMIPEDKIRVVYQSCDEIFYHRGVEAFQHNLRLPEKYILYVGALVPHKNALSLLVALKQMKDRDHHLVIVGKGKSYYRKMLSYIREQDLSGRVHFLSNHGPIDNRQLALLYRKAALFVFPSLWEGFGIPILEAMASGVPVIVNQNASLLEAAGDAALIVDVNDSAQLARHMEGVLNDESLRRHLIQKGEQQAEKFRGEHVTAQLMKAYLEVLD